MRSSDLRVPVNQDRSLGAPGALADALARAGFSEIQAREVSAPLRMASARECARFEREAFGALHQMLAALDKAARVEAWQEAERELGKYEGQNGFESPCEIIVVTAVNR